MKRRQDSGGNRPWQEKFPFPSLYTRVSTLSRESCRLLVYNLDMRIFWHQGGLHIEPEGERERAALVEIVENVRFGKPPEMRQRIPGGCSELGGEEFFEAVVGNHEASPSGNASECSDEKHIVGINVGLQVVPKLLRRPLGS